VDAAYLDVIRMNPANITAWANLGYVRWLMWDPETDGEDVAQPFRDGRRYKEIRQKTFVAELDYGLARVAAERGDIAKAYEHYINASGATMAQEATSGYIAYCFDRVNEAILGRFRRYKDRVLKVIERASQQERSRPPDRILNSVKAFALTDWGNAAAAFYRRSGDLQYREEARAAFEEALELNPRALVALRSRADLYSSLEDDPTALESAKRDLEALLEHEPRWAPGQLELVSAELALAERAVAQAAADRRTVATDAESAVEKLFGFDGVLPASWLRRAQEIERLSKLDRRQTDAILDAVTGPTAPRAFTLRARANALSDDMQAAARHLCMFLEAHFLPSDYDLRRLLLRLAEAATEQDVTERLEDLRKRLRDIVIRKVESDPPHYYWLQKLNGELEVPEQERIRLLRTAVTWPGAPAHSLRFVADELEQLGEHEWSENARERAREKERLAAEGTSDLAAALSAPRVWPGLTLPALDEVGDPGITHPLLLPEVVEDESLEAWWSLAASLVLMSIHLSGDGRLFEGLEDDERRIARQIELPALESQMHLDDVVEGLAFVNLGGLGDQLAAAQPDVDDRRVKLAHERLVTLLTEQPEPNLALGLMVVNLFHPARLVRVAAAAALAPLIADPPKLVEETLVEGSRSNSETIRQLGANALTHVSPRHRALREIIEGVEKVDRPIAPAHTSTTIHGTWARFRSNWWKPEGRLHGYLLAKVSRDLYADPDHYRWDGRYGQGARESAAEDLKTWAERHDVDEFDVVYAHSHGGNVALEAALRGVPIRLLILLSVPARRRSEDDWRKIWSNVRRSISIRSRLDLVVLADRSPLRFPDKVRELALPGLWFGHDLILQPDTWDEHKLPNEVLYERSLT
jgi:tetratricopeptide (TPR) repeat protein